jgi:hypothetical protein
VNEEDMIYWQDVLDLIAAGRTSNLVCPFCKKGQVQVTQRERVTRVECPACCRFIEGQMQE